jgi:glycosyltransferase involved in cell wall biosynthesis
MKDKTKKILICIDWFLPAYKAGGPIQSIANLVHHLKDEFAISIATSNTDLTETLDLEPGLLNIWLDKDGYRIIYLDAAHQNKGFYKKILYPQDFDVIYFNSLFSPKFTLLPLFLYRRKNVRMVLAPRGMLGKGALSIKPLKKYLFLKVFKVLNLHKHLIWHATADSEVQEIKGQFGLNLSILLAPNLSAQAETHFQKKVKFKGALNIFFLSRIAIKKNLRDAIGYLSKIDDKHKITFTIIGPVDEVTYWENCQNAIGKLSQNIDVKILGAIPNSELPAILAHEHVLLLPTHHENFGHVIMESWQSGCPVIISDQTPWRGLGPKQLGFDMALRNPNAFIEALQFFSLMDANAYNVWSKASYDFAKTFTQNPELIKQNKALFLNSIKNQ